MAEKLDAVDAEILKNIDNKCLLRLKGGRLVGVVLPGFLIANVECWIDRKGDVQEITYKHSSRGKIGSVNLCDGTKHYSKTNFENKHLFNSDNKELATRLEELPPLKKGFVRLKHRCMSEDVGNILNVGLVFNRSVAKTDVGGASYTDISSMASCYESSDEFWDSMKSDDFACFDNSRHADTQVIMDMPIEEFEFLQKHGRRVHGKVDSKYIVGVVRNYNGSNNDLVMPEDEVEKARMQSEQNPEQAVVVNDIALMRSVMEWRRKNRQAKMD